jgi:hypothetical protein
MFERLFNRKRFEAGLLERSNDMIELAQKAPNTPEGFKLLEAILVARFTILDAKSTKEADTIVRNINQIFLEATT